MTKEKFKKGYRVKALGECGATHHTKNLKNKKGTIKKIKNNGLPICVEFDDDIGGHDGLGVGRDDHCWWCKPEQLESIEHYKQYIGKKVAVHCKTQEEWDRVMKVLRDKADRYDVWYVHKNKTCLDCEDGRYQRKDFYKEKGYKIISCAEFFGEEEKDCKYNNKSIINKTMTKVLNFAKNALLSKKEKLFRELGLKDECGNYTDEYNALRALKANEAFEGEAYELAKKMKEEEALKSVPK